MVMETHPSRPAADVAAADVAAADAADAACAGVKEGDGVATAGEAGEVELVWLPGEALMPSCSSSLQPSP